MSSEKMAGLAIEKQNDLVRKGDRVLVNGSAVGKGGNRIYPVYSSQNGIYQGKQYFFCPRGHGAMVKRSDIIPLNSVPRKWPVNGNQMFPSYEEIKKHRKLREELIKESEEKFYKEHQAKRKAQMERFSKSATLQSISDKDCDVGDYHKQADVTVENSWEKLNSVKMKKYFGNDEKAERMAATLRKLRSAFEQGRLMILKEQT